jgi:predicted transcriptional regulator
MRLRRKTKEALDRLAASTGRSRSCLVAEAIETYVALDRWQVEGIGRALAEADAGGPSVAHEDVARWLDSWGDEEELPPPRPAG